MNTKPTVKIVLVLLVNFVLAGCRSATTPIPTITPTSTLIPSSTLAPTLTPTRAPTLTPTPTALRIERTQILDYIASLSSATSYRGVISGQQAGSIDDLTDDTWYHGYSSMIEALHDKTGEWPGIIGDEYEWGHVYTPAQFSDANKVLIDYARAGGIVFVSFTPMNPWLNDESDIMANPGDWQGPESALSGLPAGASLDDLLDPTKPVHAAWMRKLDRIAGALQELRDAGVVVLFGPLQEMNASWYWWGISSHPSDPGPYIRVWRAMYDYFTNEKGLNNLIWGYSPSSTYGTNTRTSPLFRAVDWAYPGDDYVDIISFTNYSDDMSISDYNVYVKMGKPLGIDGYGPNTDSSFSKNGTWDLSNIIQRMRNDYPRIAFFVCWSSFPWSHLSLISNLNADKLLADPLVINRDDLPWNVR